MGDSLRYKDWFEKAAQDLRGAEILMAHGGGKRLGCVSLPAGDGESSKRLALENYGGAPGGAQPCFLVQKGNLRRGAVEGGSPGLRLC